VPLRATATSSADAAKPVATMAAATSSAGAFQGMQAVVKLS